MPVNVPLRAGDEIRTRDVQLGNPNGVDRKHNAAKEVTSSHSLRCIARCTESEETANADPLAGFVASLTPEQRKRLADLLVGSKEGDAP
jgi:hypothetical protein